MMRSITQELLEQTFDPAQRGFVVKSWTERIIERCAQEADKTADTFVFGKQKIGAIAAGKAIRALKGKL